MAEPYLSELRAIVERLRAQDDGLPDVSCKHFFSGAAAYVGGQIFMSLSPVGLALKLSEADCTALFKQGATPLHYFPKAPAKQGYAVLPAKMAKEEACLAGWVVRSLAFARNKPT